MGASAGGEGYEPRAWGWVDLVSMTGGLFPLGERCRVWEKIRCCLMQVCFCETSEAMSEANLPAAVTITRRLRKGFRNLRRKWLMLSSILAVRYIYLLPVYRHGTTCDLFPPLYQRG